MCRCKDIVDKFFQNKKNSNCLLELEELLLSSNENVILASIDAFESIFNHIFNEDMLVENDNLNTLQEKYRLWLLDRYNDFIGHLLNYIQVDNQNIQKRSLESLMHFIEVEVKKPLNKEAQNKWHIPENLMKKIISCLLSEVKDQSYLIMKFEDYLEFNDIKFFTLKSILNIFNNANQPTDIFLKNCFYLLSEVHFPKENQELFSLCTKLGIHEDIKMLPVIGKKKFSRIFSSTWMRFLKYELPPNLYKKILIVLHKKVLPYIKNPCLLTDFLTDSYNKGGIASLLSLNSLFYLMQTYNVEYPDFFVKLYGLFNRDIINSKFNARFFYLSDIFLSSTHLPAYIVAAFIKRLSRLSLCSNTNIVLKIIPFICNLLRRHPPLKILIHRPNPQNLDKDPYNFDEMDLAKCNAMESSLWEIKTLQSHVNPDVSRKAKAINSELNRIEEDISNLLDVSLYDLYNKEIKRKFQEAPLAIHEPSNTENWWSF